jgi:hypothetical protein
LNRKSRERWVSDIAYSDLDRHWGLSKVLVGMGQDAFGSLSVSVMRQGASDCPNRVPASIAAPILKPQNNLF